VNSLSGVFFSQKYTSFKHMSLCVIMCNAQVVLMLN